MLTELGSVQNPFVEENHAGAQTDPESGRKSVLTLFLLALGVRVFSRDVESGMDVILDRGLGFAWRRCCLGLAALQLAIQLVRLSIFTLRSHHEGVVDGEQEN